MRNVAIAVLLLAAACASSKDVATAPPPQGTEPRTGDLQTSMTELLERIDVLNDRVARLEQANDQRPAPPAVSSPATAAGNNPPREAPVLRSTPATGQTGTAATASRAVLNAQMADRYRNAIVLFGKNQLPQARNAFQQIFDADPTGELADNALFWVGETYYAAGSYQEAIRFYKRVGDDYGEQNKAPDAMYKLALAFEKTGDLMQARTTLQDVIKRYPYSASASAAKAELNRIKY